MSSKTEAENRLRTPDFGLQALNMKTHKIFFLFVVVAFLSFGYTRCNTRDFSNEINQVDSLLAIAEQLHQNILKIDSADVMEKAKLVDADFKFVQDSLPGELFIEASLFLTQLKSVKKMTGSFPNKFKSLKNETDYSIDQLTDLKSDLKNRSLNAGNVSKYIQDESKALAVLGQHINKLMMALDKLNNQYFENRLGFYNLYREYQASN